MERVQLTQFQQTAEKALTDLLAEIGRRVEQREVLSGTIPFFAKEPQTALRLTSGDVSVLLYDDEATLTAGARSTGFERADFGSSDALLENLLTRVREEIVAS